jgi:hypothetical protein
LGFGVVEEQEEGDVIIKSNIERNPRKQIGRQRNDTVVNVECQVQQDIQMPGVRGVPIKRRGEV